jgi:glutathione-regulated potassium-efflux system ancillary protein KefC
VLVVGFVTVKAVVMAAIARAIGVPGESRGMLSALLSQGSEFAFVVFGVATSARVFPGSWDKVLTLVVALSMAATPLLVIAARKLEERAGRRQAREADAVEADDAPVIIAGFGRFGQIVGRLLFASGLRATVLDFDAEQIDVMRRFGFRVFYGDATRLDLLHAAGAERAKVIVNAIDDQVANLRLVDLVKHHFPHARIVSRARDVTHLYELRRRGVTVAERETFESALRVGRHVFEALGVRPHEARERADQFRRHNVGLLQSLGATAIGDAERTARVRAARDELERQFQRDVKAIERLEGGDWARERDG